MRTRILAVAAVFSSLVLAGCPTTTLLPNADFTAGVYSGEAPLAVVFGDASTSTMEPITSWQWDFGDGQFASTQNANHVYQSTGKYTVSLTVNTASATDTETKTDIINVFRPPAPNFSASPTSGRAPLQVQFANSTVAGSSPVQTYFWDFGDGGNSAEANPTHTYTEPGTYDVYVYAIDENGARPVRKKDLITVTD